MRHASRYQRQSRSTKRKLDKGTAAFTQAEKDGFFGYKDARDTAIFRVVYHRGLQASAPIKLPFPAL